MDKMRILIVGSTYPPHTNGQSIFTANLAQGLVRMGHEVLVFKPSEHGQPYQIEEDGVRVVAIRSLHLAWISNDIYLAFSYRKVVEKIFDTYRPEVVHLQDSAPICRYVARVAHERGLRVMATHHIGPEVGATIFSGLSKWFRQALNSIVWIWLLSYLNRMDLVIAPSKAAVAMLKRRGLKSPVYPLSCGVDLQHFHPDGVCRDETRKTYHLDPTKKLFLYVGRLDIEKRVDVLVQAMADVKNTDVQLVLAGTGAVEAKLKELAAHFDLGERVRFLGHIPHEQLNALINCADVFVMPGDAESLSIATLEAMACAKPVLAVNAMALPELVAEGVNGSLFPPGNPSAAANAVDGLVEQAGRWVTMGKTSLEKVAVHDLRYVLSEYVKIYAKITRTNPMNAVENGPSTSRYPHRRRWLSGVHIPRHIQLIIWLCLLLLGSILLFNRSTAAPTMHLDSLVDLSLESVNRLLVFSPHPDDEILGVGGLIQGALEQGTDVRVVLVTNGDGQAWSPVLLDRRPYYPTSQHYVKLGQRRQEESLAALRAIGLPDSHIFFLGYADGSLYPMWIKDWSKDTSPISARYTRAVKSPYQLTYNSQAVYWGEDVLRDLITILADFQPDLLVLPHPSDTHSDHRAPSNYVRMAVSMVSAVGEQDPPRMLAYVVHYDTYPQPRGLNLAKALLPPSSLVNKDTVWTNYNLSVKQAQNKLAAIAAYPSQEQVNGNYLRSFARLNEVFLEIQVLDLPTIAYEGREMLENGVEAAISLKEPVSASMRQKLLGGADLVGWHTLRFGDQLCLGVATRGRWVPGLSYRILVKTSSGETHIIRNPKSIRVLGSNSFNACVDLKELGNPPVLGFSAEVWQANLVDRTAWHFVIVRE